MPAKSNTMTALADLARLIAAGIPADVGRDELARKTDAAMKGIFGERYPQKLAKAENAFRTVLMTGEENISFAGLLHEDSPSSDVYGGMSLIWFPVPREEATPAGSLLTFVCGTRGLPPDEHILGRPGHARHLQALRWHLAQSCGARIWTKQDPTNLAQAFPKVIAEQYPQFKQVISRYGNYI